MTYRQIETSRELRLWIGQVIVPAAIAAGYIASKPELREKITTKFKEVKHNIGLKLVK